MHHWQAYHLGDCWCGWKVVFKWNDSSFCWCYIYKYQRYMCMCVWCVCVLKQIGDFLSDIPFAPINDKRRQMYPINAMSFIRYFVPARHLHILDESYHVYHVPHGWCSTTSTFVFQPIGPMHHISWTGWWTYRAIYKTPWSHTYIYMYCFTRRILL